MQPLPLADEIDSMRIHKFYTPVRTLLQFEHFGIIIVNLNGIWDGVGMWPLPLTGDVGFVVEIHKDRRQTSLNAYLIFVTDTTDGVRVNFFWPV